MLTKKLAIIQARMSSSRLPGKVLMEIGGYPMLQCVVERTQAAKSIEKIVVATTTDSSDDVLEQFCHRMGYLCFRGNPSDVLDRYYQTVAKYPAEVIIRLTADCPLIDPDIIDLTVTAFLGRPLPQNPPYSSQLSDNYSPVANPFDFAANRLPPPWKRTLPIGLDVEVCSFPALHNAWKEADRLYHREHVMTYLYEGVTFPLSDLSSKTEWYLEQNTTPLGFKVALLNHYPDYSSMRWTVDTFVDLEFVRQIYARFGGRVDFGWQDVIELLEKEPDLVTINAAVKHKSAFDVDKRTTGA